MRQRNFHVDDAQFVGDFFRASGQKKLGRAVRTIDDFDVRPRNPGRPTGAQRLQRRLFRRPTRRQRFAEITSFPQTILAFALRKDSIQKGFRKSLVKFHDAFDLRRVRSNTDDSDLFVPRSQTPFVEKQRSLLSKAFYRKRLKPPRQTLGKRRKPTAKIPASINP